MKSAKQKGALSHRAKSMHVIVSDKYVLKKTLFYHDVTLSTLVAVGGSSVFMTSAEVSTTRRAEFMHVLANGFRHIFYGRILFFITM